MHFRRKTALILTLFATSLDSRRPRPDACNTPTAPRSLTEEEGGGWSASYVPAEYLLVVGSWDVWGSTSRVELVPLDVTGDERVPTCLQSLQRLPGPGNSGSEAVLEKAGKNR